MSDDAKKQITPEESMDTIRRRLEPKSKDEIIEYIQKKGRPTQVIHGTDEDDTKAAHRFMHAGMIDVLNDNKESLTKKQVIDIVCFIDSDVRVGPTRWNKEHSRSEDQHAANVGKGTHITAKAVERTKVVLDQIKYGLSEKFIDPMSAGLLIANVGKIKTEGVSVLQLYRNDTNYAAEAVQWKRVFEKELTAAVTETAACMSEVVTNKDGRVSKTSSVVRQGHLRYLASGKVDPKCQAYVEKFVDDDGHVIAHRPSGPGLKWVDGYTRNGTEVHGYFRKITPAAEVAKNDNDATATAEKKPAVPNVTHVAGYTREDGTKVKGYTRANPTAAAPEPVTATSVGKVEVAGYTREDGTRVSGYTRSVASSQVSPGLSRVQTTSSSSSSGGGGSTYVTGYTRSNGTEVSGYTRSSGGGGGGGGGSTYVSGYTRSNGTVVSGYTRGGKK